MNANLPDKVYELWLHSSIRERRVLGSDGVHLSIRVGGYDVNARQQPDGTYTYSYHCFYPTWESAREAALSICRENIKKAKKAIKSNQRAIEKLEGMKKPTAQKEST